MVFLLNRSSLMPALLLFTLSACSKSQPEPAAKAGTAFEPPAAAKPASKSTAKSAFPKAARRDSPPPGIDGRALAVGATASPFTLTSSAGTSWSLEQQLAKWGRAGGLNSKRPLVLFFYRGHW